MTEPITYIVTEIIDARSLIAQLSRATNRSVLYKMISCHVKVVKFSIFCPLQENICSLALPPLSLSLSRTRREFEMYQASRVRVESRVWKLSPSPRHGLASSPPRPRLLIPPGVYDSV